MRQKAILDYTLKTTEERLECAQKVIDTTPKEDMTSMYKKAIADYILFLTEKNQTKKEKKKEHPISTKNREITIRNRTMSYEGLADDLKHGEDDIMYMAGSSEQFLDNKESLTHDDIEEIPGIKDYLHIIDTLKKQLPDCEGKQKYLIKKHIIETYQQIYILKASYKGWPAKSKVSAQLKTMVHMNLPEHVTFDEKGYPVSDCTISLFNPVHISFLLNYYQTLKQESYEDLESDMKWMLIDFDRTVDRALKNDKILYNLLIYKIDGYENAEIAEMMRQEFGVNHSVQFYATTWSKRIPKIIAEQAQKDYLVWYYSTQKYGKWKRCGKCGKMKLAHPLFFSRNAASKDGLYSTCRECRTISRKNKIK